MNFLLNNNIKLLYTIGIYLLNPYNNNNFDYRTRFVVKPQRRRYHFKILLASFIDLKLTTYKSFLKKIKGIFYFSYKK